MSCMRAADEVSAPADLIADDACKPATCTTPKAWTSSANA